MWVRVPPSAFVPMGFPRDGYDLEFNEKLHSLLNNFRDLADVQSTGIKPNPSGISRPG